MAFFYGTLWSAHTLLRKNIAMNPWIIGGLTVLGLAKKSKSQKPRGMTVVGGQTTVNPRRMVAVIMDVSSLSPTDFSVIFWGNSPKALHAITVNHAAIVGEIFVSKVVSADPLHEMAISYTVTNRATTEVEHVTSTMDDLQDVVRQSLLDNNEVNAATYYVVSVDSGFVMFGVDI